MILEIAAIQITPGAEGRFEAAVRDAVPLFRAARGCLAMEIVRCLETSASYRLIVRWQTLENHIIDFRNSPDFLKWRALITPFLAAPLQVENNESIGVSF